MTTGLPIRYVGPPTPQALAAQLGVPLEQICKLDANENPYGPPPAALAALATFGQMTGAPLGAGRYPDPSASELRAALRPVSSASRRNRSSSAMASTN